jgi:CheY-like chemotaxis protein
MARPSLEGRSILVVEDEPFIVLDITPQFEVTGAALTTTNTLKHALILVEHDGLSGAIARPRRFQAGSMALDGWRGPRRVARD